MIPLVMRGGLTGPKSSIIPCKKGKNKRGMKEKPTYEQAKRRCGMTDTEVEMAIRLRVSPETLIRNASSRKAEKWKDPIPLIIRRMYEKRFEKEALEVRTVPMKRIGKKKAKDPILECARRLGFTRSECWLAKELNLTEQDLIRMQTRSKKSGGGLSPALLVRRMYESVIGNRQKKPE